MRPLRETTKPEPTPSMEPSRARCVITTTELRAFSVISSTVFARGSAAKLCEMSSRKTAHANCDIELLYFLRGRGGRQNFQNVLRIHKPLVHHELRVAPHRNVAAGRRRAVQLGHGCVFLDRIAKSRRHDQNFIQCEPPFQTSHAAMR